MENPFDILFEPVQISPEVSPNCFYQVPHYHQVLSVSVKLKNKLFMEKI
jgi:hypothetical protein